MENLKSGAFAPTCSRETWIKRQALMTKVRDFFVRRNALEVETPVLSAYGGTDPQLDYFEIEEITDAGHQRLALNPSFTRASGRKRARVQIFHFGHLLKIHF